MMPRDSVLLPGKPCDTALLFGAGCVIELALSMRCSVYPGADRADADVPAREDQLEGPADGHAVPGARAQLAAHDGQARAN